MAITIPESIPHDIQIVIAWYLFAGGVALAVLLNKRKS